MNNWISLLAEKAMQICRVNKRAVGNHRQDETLPILQQLQGDGYTTVTWDSGNSTHSKCIELDKQIFDLSDFIRSTTHDAPLFCRSHPGDVSCALLVSGEGLPTIRLDSFGNTLEI